MPLRGRDTPTDRPRNELEEDEEEEEEEESKYHHSGTDNGEDVDDAELGSMEQDGDEDAGRQCL